jgi:hypothetical protein
MSLIAVCLVATLLLTRLDIPKPAAHERENSGRPLGEIMAQPVFFVPGTGGRRHALAHVASQEPALRGVTPRDGAAARTGRP